MNRSTLLAACLTLVVGSSLAFAGKGDAEKGKEVFQQCAVCHNADSTEKKMGPGLKGLFKMPPHKMADGTIMSRHDEPTIRKQVELGSSSMPPMKGVLSKQELDDLIAYLRTL